MASPSVASILDDLATARKSYENNEAGSRETLIENSQALVSLLEIPTELIQRSFWVEPAMSANIRIAVDVKVFQHLKNADSAGQDATTLAERTGALASGGNETPYEAQVHDFFTPQPIRAARAYALHSILHDWGDGEGIKISEDLVPALKKGYPRVLLNEIVVSEEKPTLAATSMDMMMLAHFAGRERTEASRRAIIGRVGLKVTNIYTYSGVAESLTEAELI